MRAVPIFFPLPNRSICRERIRAESGRMESRAAVWVYCGAIRKASAGVGPATNSAGPADESHGDASGLTTTLLSGSGTDGTTVSFRPATGVLRSQAIPTTRNRGTSDLRNACQGLRAHRCIATKSVSPVPIVNETRAIAARLRQATYRPLTDSV